MGFLNLFDSWKVGLRTYLRHSVYYPGNVVEGFVECSMSSKITMIAVRVLITGHEEVIIQRESSDGDGGTNTETYDEKITFFEQLITLAGQTKYSGNRQHIEVPAGKYTYPFAFQLPLDLPPSFKRSRGGDTAHIAYHIEAYVDIPRGMDANHRSYFSVVKPMPQNQWIHRAPSTVDRQFDITLCCCIDKGKVKARMFMDRTHIAIDRDFLVVCADIDNTLGKEPVKSLEVNLMHRLRYQAGGAMDNFEINEGQIIVKNQEVPPGGKGRIAGTIRLPTQKNLVPSLACFNVFSEYWIDLELNIPWASDPKHLIPVIVAQTVDDSNFSPPINWQQNPYACMRGMAPEFYYQPPPQPCFQLNPIPCAPPANYQYNNYAPTFDLQMPLPRDNVWANPVYDVPAPKGGMQASQIPWGTGLPQHEVAPVQPHVPQVATGAEAYGQQQNYGGAWDNTAVASGPGMGQQQPNPWGGSQPPPAQAGGPSSPNVPPPRYVDPSEPAEQHPLLH